MRKLTEKTKYSYDKDGALIIHARLKTTGKWVKAYICHPSCLDLILKNKSIFCENVVLRNYLGAR
jgi:predicted glutamine amidotransferase